MEEVVVVALHSLDHLMSELAELWSMVRGPRSFSHISPHLLARSLACQLARAARLSILSVLEAAIQVGYLEIEDEDETFHFGTPKAGGPASLRTSKSSAATLKL